MRENAEYWYLISFCGDSLFIHPLFYIRIQVLAYFRSQSAVGGAGLQIERHLHLKRRGTARRRPQALFALARIIPKIKTYAATVEQTRPFRSILARLKRQQIPRPAVEFAADFLQRLEAHAVDLTGFE